MSLVKHDQILSIFNQAYYYTNYCTFSLKMFENVIIRIEIIVFSVGKCYYKEIVLYDFG